jgi:hypothetical protein
VEAGRSCIFCLGRGDLTREHVFPVWLGKALGASATHVTTQQFTKNDRVLRSYEAPGFSLKSKAVCRLCNNGWMSQLEYNVKPVLERLALGQWPVVLSEEECARLGAWVIKTVVMLEMAQPTPAVIPQSHRSHLATTSRPPARAQVWAGARPPGQAPTRFDHQSGGDSESDLHDGYIALLGIGQFFGYVVSFPSTDRERSEDPPPDQLSFEEIPIFKRLWPTPARGVRLPPKWSCDDQSLDDLWPSLRA